MGIALITNTTIGASSSHSSLPGHIKNVMDYEKSPNWSPTQYSMYGSNRPRSGLVRSGASYASYDAPEQREHHSWQRAAYEAPEQREHHSWQRAAYEAPKQREH